MDCRRHRASRLALEAATTLAEAGGGRNLQFEGPAWNSSTVDLIRLAKAHGYLVLVQNFFAHVDGLRQKARDAPTEQGPMSSHHVLCVRPCLFVWKEVGIC